VQRAKHEIERTLDAIPEGLVSRRPKSGDVATLGKGQFYASFGREMYKVYVQPAWMKAAHAEAIARGEEPVESAREVLHDYQEEHPEDAPPTRESHGDQELSRAEQVHPVPITDEEIVDAVKEIAEEPMKPVTDAEHIAELREIAKSPWATPWLPFMLGQYDAVVAAHDALAARVGAMGGMLREHGSIAFIERTRHLSDSELVDLNERARRDGVDKNDFAAVQRFLDRVLPSPSAKAEKAETGGALSGPPPATTEGPLSTLNSREDRSNPGREFKPAALSPDEIYAYIRERAKNERDPVILHLLTTQPELRVKITRQIIEADGGTLRGQLAILISERFFDQARSFTDIRNECLRRNFIDKKMSNATLSGQLAKLGELGFLTSEPTGYQAVPGMRVFIEDPARESHGDQELSRVKDGKAVAAR
jgi:hypothetical protein